MPTIDLPFSLVEQMLNQASTGEQLLSILDAVTTPDPVEDTVVDVTEEDEDEQEPSDNELNEVRDEVVIAILETEEFDPQVIEQELQDWDHIPNDAFVTL